MPGAEMGRGPSTRSSAWMLAEVITRGGPAPESSTAIISDRARPSQPMEASPLRFSRRSTARRSADAPAGWRMQLVKRSANRRAGKNAPLKWVMAARKATLRGQLENTRLQGQQFLELGQFAQPGDGRVVGQLLALLIAPFESFSQVLEGEFVAPILRVEGGHHVVELGAILHGALLQQHAVAGVVLENLGIELDRGAVFLIGESNLVARVVDRKSTRLNS